MHDCIVIFIYVFCIFCGLVALAFFIDPKSEGKTFKKIEKLKHRIEKIEERFND